MSHTSHTLDIAETLPVQPFVCTVHNFEYLLKGIISLKAVIRCIDCFLIEPTGRTVGRTPAEFVRKAACDRRSRYVKFGGL
jgi:hypothetical protein